MVTYTIITLLYGWSELGYIFLWTVFHRPYEFYSQLNDDKWDGELSKYLTNEKGRCCFRRKPGKEGSANDRKALSSSQHDSKADESNNQMYSRSQLMSALEGNHSSTHQRLLDGYKESEVDPLTDKY